MGRLETLSAWTAAKVLRPEIFAQYGMKRSGNHAISGWLGPKLRATHINNIIPMGPVYAGSADVPDLDEFAAWFFSQPSARSQRLHRKFLIGRAGLPGRVYTSVEDLPTTLGLFRRNAPSTLLVIRSFENMMSSRIRKASKVDMPAYPLQTGPVIRRVVDTWKQHARCYLRLNDETTDRVAILFDAFASDEGYRNAVCVRLGVPPGDDGLERVSDTGGGSSFTGTEFDGRASAMPLAGRRNDLSGREAALLDEILADPELRELDRLVSQADPVRQI